MITPEHHKLFAVIGNPVRHSLSPVMMGAAFAAMRIPALYTAFGMNNLVEDLAVLHKAGFSGLSVTIPFKEEARRLAVEIDDTAEQIGAVNTLRRAGSGWEGCNTDWVGALRALSRIVDPGGKRALVLGAGGAARAVVFGLRKAGAGVVLANRTVARGQALADRFGCQFLPLGELESGADFDIVVQCTSVGLDAKTSAPLVSDSFFRRGMTVMDIVYRPSRTPFTLAAERAGCTIVSGLEMLLYQGVAQLEWWLGLPVAEIPAVAAMRVALTKAVENE